MVREAELASVTEAQLQEEGELLGVQERPGRCGTREEVQTYQFWVEAEDGEEPEIAEVVIRHTNHTNVPFLPMKEEEVIKSLYSGYFLECGCDVQGSATIVTFRPELNCLEQSDPDLAAAIRQLYLLPPSDRPYNRTR